MLSRAETSALSDQPLRFEAHYRWIGRALILLILVLSLARTGPAGLPVPHGDKWGHLIAYAALSYWYASFIRDRCGRIWRALAFVALGAMIEILQSFTSHRSAEWADLYADALGVALGMSLALTPLGRLLPALDRRIAG